MRPARGFAALLLAAAYLPAQHLPPCPLPDEVRVAVQKATGDEPMALLRALGGMDLPVRAKALEQWQGLDERSRCAVVRAGLRSTDDAVATGAAAMAKSHWLDLQECRRAAAVGLPRCLLPDSPFDIGSFFELLDGEDAGRLLAGPIPLPRSVPLFLGPLHHRLGPEHVPQLVQLARSDDVLLREAALHYLLRGISADPAHQEKVAELVLSWPGSVTEADFDPQEQRQAFKPRPYTLRPAGPGYPPLLAALLERVFLQPCEEELHPARTLVWRWSLTATPAQVDRELLLRLCGSEVDRGRCTGVRGLQQLTGKRVDDAVRKVAAAADGEDESLAKTLALGALAASGDEDATRQLRDLAASSPLGLAVRLHVAREAAFRELLDEVIRADAATAVAALERLEEALEDGANAGLGLADPGTELATALGPKNLEAAKLACLLRLFPAARTKPLCEQLLQSMQPEQFEQLPLGVLELHDPERLLAKLRGWFTDEAVPRAIRDLVARALLRVGDQGSAKGLWAWAQQVADEEDRITALLQFGACGGADVLKLLAEQVPKDPPRQGNQQVAPLAATVAAFAGDTRLASELLQELVELPPDDFAAAWRALSVPLLAGKGADAVVAWLALRPLDRGELSGLGAFGEAVTPYLRRACTEREHGCYLWAIGELALMGITAARNELDLALARRLYRWIDDLDPEVLVGRGNVEGVVKALPQLASNCCTYAVVATRLQDVFEVDGFPRDDGARPRGQLVTERWWQVGDRWRWSWLAGRLVAGPR